MKRLLILIFITTYSFSVSASDLDSLDLETYFEQNQIENLESNSDGVYFTFDQKGEGALPKAGDYVMINYVGKLLNGNVFDESGTESFVFQLGYRQVIRGWEYGIPMLPVGTKATLYIPSELGYGKVGAGNVIPQNADLIYEVEVLRIMDYDEYDIYMEELDRKEQLAFEKAQKDQFALDKKLIHEYTVANKIKTVRLPSGISYSLKKKGKGRLPNDGDKITFHYEGYLLDGSVFDNSYDRKEPFSFEFGKGKAIKGLEEALRNFKKGNQGWILIPSKYAYGPMEIDENGTFIPANAVLVFKVKILKIE